MDHVDVLRILKTIPAPKPTAEEIYPDVVLAYTFLVESKGRCYSHGRHELILASDVKKIAENYIGRTVNDTAFFIAIRMAGLEIKKSRTDQSMLLKLPPLGRFEEVRDLWNQRQATEQKQIDEEIERWAAFKAKYPSYRYQ
jgi:hypothetical protein